jgi:hypothetical protein
MSNHDGIILSHWEAARVDSVLWASAETPRAALIVYTVLYVLLKFHDFQCTVAVFREVDFIILIS